MLRLSWIFIGILLLFILVREGCNRREINKLETERSLIQLREQSAYDSIKNRDEKIIYLQQVISFEQKKGQKALSDYADSIFNLKKRDERKYKETVAYYENYISTYLPQYVYIPYIDSSNQIGKDTSEYLKNSVRVPRGFELKNSYFNIRGSVLKSGVKLDSLNIPDTLRGRFVEKKNGLFKPETIEYQVFNTNPYIQIQGGKSAVYTAKKKPFKFILPIIVGTVLGIIIAK